MQISVGSIHSVQLTISKGVPTQGWDMARRCTVGPLWGKNHRGSIEGGAIARERMAMVEESHTTQCTRNNVFNTDVNKYQQRVWSWEEA